MERLQAGALLLRPSWQLASTNRHVSEPSWMSSPAEPSVTLSVVRNCSFRATKKRLGSLPWCEFQGRQDFAFQQECWKVRYTQFAPWQPEYSTCPDPANWKFLLRSFNLQLVMQRSTEGLGFILVALVVASSVQWRQPWHPHQFFSGINLSFSCLAPFHSHPSILQVDFPNLLVILWATW